jgi:predicted extracellular nuclease
MKNPILSFILLCTLSVNAVERVSLEQLQADWSQYTNQMVQVTTPLVVCGSFYDSLLLAPERLFCPEERAVGLADGDSTAYWQIVESNRAHSIVVHCRNSYYKVRTGDRVRGLSARVTSERHLVSGQGVKTSHAPVDKLPKPKKGELRIVGANIENYFADLGGYAHQRTTPEQQALKTRKVVAAMRAMHADIFALCEMQIGDKAPQMLLAELNKSGNNYAFVSMPLNNIDRIGGCFIYNKKRVRPYEQPLSAYRDTADHYHGRMFAQGFEETKSGQRLIISLNHLKSKRPGRTQYDTNIRRMENTDSLLVMLPKAITLYGDPDLLLLGDYNCYTQEQPIQTLVRAGYADMLPHGQSADYSYVFKGESGYLDRCFANPSMATQIVRVRPWHVNADWYYQHGAYKMKDSSLHRYADHDPIIVDVNLR